MTELATKKCTPCQGGVPPLDAARKAELLEELNAWKLVDDHHLSKSYSFSNYAKALNWVNKISEIAESENHHPDVYLSWGLVRIDIWTHKIDNITESDFILAAKLDHLESNSS